MEDIYAKLTYHGGVVYIVRNQKQHKNIDIIIIDSFQ